MLDVGLGDNFSREPQGNNSLELSSPGCAAMIASRALAIPSVLLLLITALFALFLLLATASFVNKGLMGQRASSESDDVKQHGQFGRVVLVLVSLVTALLLPLLVSLLVWAKAAGFSGGQWNAYVYLFFAAIAYFLVVLWSALWYNRRLLAEVTSATLDVSQRVEAGDNKMVIGGAGTPTSSSASYIAQDNGV